MQSLVKVQQPRPRIAVLDAGVGEEGSEEKYRQRNGIRGVACSPVFQSLFQPLSQPFSQPRRNPVTGQRVFFHFPVWHVGLRELLGLTVSSLWD